MGGGGEAVKVEEAEVVAVEEAAASTDAGAEIKETPEVLMATAGRAWNRSGRRGGTTAAVTATAVAVTVEAAAVSVAAGVAETAGRTARCQYLCQRQRSRRH